MQWILQQFEDTAKLAEALDRLDLPYIWHEVVPFEGRLIPNPDIADSNAVILFGSYALWRLAEARGWRPGVFRIRPFVHEAPWTPFLLNGPGARFVTLRDLPAELNADDQPWFVRPVDDSKAQPGGVRTGAEIIATARKVLALREDEIPGGSLRHDTALMLCPPVRILRE